MPQQNILKVLFGQCGVDSVQLQVLCCRVWMPPFDLTFSRSISLTSFNLTHVQTNCSNMFNKLVGDFVLLTD